MGEQLIKSYQISIWDDKLVGADTDESYYEEVKIAEIGSDTMTSKNRVYSPVFKINTNGEKTLTFSLKSKYYDEIVGDFVVNPFKDFLVNERKVKLFYKNEWHDFVIKEIEEESEEYTFSYTCTDAFVQELARNGYGITLNSELNNNQGTITELAEKVLEDTDWVVDKDKSDLLRQTLSEPIYQCQVTNSSFQALNTDTNQMETISQNEHIYIFYSYIANAKTEYIQFLRASDSSNWIYDDNNAIIGTNYRILEPVTYGTRDGSIVINYGSAAINVGPINTESQGYRLVYNVLTTFDPVMNKTVGIYRINYEGGGVQDIYHYTDTEYGTASILTNYITNGNHYTTYNGTGITGWSEAVDTKADRFLDLGITTYPELTSSASLAQISELKQIEGFLELEFPANVGDSKYQYSFFNSGALDNSSAIGNIVGGERFLLRVRYRTSPTKHGSLTNPSLANVNLRAVLAGYTIEQKEFEDGSINLVKKIDEDKIYLDFTNSFHEANVVISGGTFSNNYSNYILNGIIQTPSNNYIYREEGSNVDYKWSYKQNQFIPINNSASIERQDEWFTNYYYTTAVAEKSISQDQLKDSVNRIGLFIYKTNTTDEYVYIEDIEITKYFQDINGNPIFVGSAPESKAIKIDRFYIKPNEGMTASNIELYSSLESIANNFNVSLDSIVPVQNENCEKILSIEASKSNCFNILQTLCETFECWLKIDVAHDSIGKIKLDENHNPIKRIYFKEYVGKDNFAGFKYGVNLNSINRSIDSNEFVTKLIVGQPASDYTSNGVLSIGDATSNPSGESYILNFNYYLNQGLIQNKNEFNTDVANFYDELKHKNIDIQNLTDELVAASAAFEHAKANRNIYAESTEVASEKYAKALSNFETVVGQSYADFAASNPNPEEIADNTALLKAIDDIYAAAIQVNNYSGLLENLNKEFNDLNIKCNGIPTYSFTVTTYHNQDDSSLDSTKLLVSDYIEGFECTFSSNGLITQWKSEINDKDFVEKNIYTQLIIKKIPENYELEYTSNRETCRTPVNGPLIFEIYDSTNNVGLAKNFRLIPTDEYAAGHKGLSQLIDELIEEKKEIEKEFYTKYSRFIQEGTWESSDYINPELYYLDAVQVSNTSAQPKVSYTINVIEVSELEGLENYDFNVGDKTYIEDTDFFGWKIDTKYGVITRTPIKEEVIVSGIEWHLDEPDLNIITIQNYKTQFEDLFQRISATVQSVQYNQAAYNRAASILDSNGRINSSLLANSLNAMGGLSYNLSGGGIVKTTSEGLIVQNLTEPRNLLIIRSSGIERSTDGGYTWVNLISPQGVNTEELTSGSINTRNISIMDGENPSFRWDTNGISAFSTNTNGSYDLNTYVRYDKYGLYGVQNGEGYVATSLEDIKDKANFGLTWDGFFIKNKYKDGYVSISSDNDFQVVANGTERIKIGHFNDTDTYGIRIKNSQGQTVFDTDDDGNIEIAGTIRAAAGNIADFNIANGSLIYGTPGQTGSVLLSSSYYSDSLIGGIRNDRPWVLAAGSGFGVDDRGRLYAQEATIHGNIYADNGYFNGYVNATGGNFSEIIKVGDGDRYIQIDASSSRADSLIASSDYINNPSAGWAISGAGDAIFNNVSVRGAIKTAVFEYNEIEAVGGAFLFRPSTTIKSASISGNDLVLILEKPNLFRVGEWVKLSNVNTESSGVNDILNDGGLTHVYQVSAADGKRVTLTGAAIDFKPPQGQVEEEYDEWGYMTVDAETGIPTYSTVTFAVGYGEDEQELSQLTNYVDLTKTVNGQEVPIELNAPKYEVYFDGMGAIKTLNFDLVNDLQYNQVLSPSQSDNPSEKGWYEYISGEYVPSTDTVVDLNKTYYYKVTRVYEPIIVEGWGINEDNPFGGICIIYRYIGNLSIFFPTLANTGEDFLVAEVEYPSGDTYTRIFSNLSGERTFTLKAARVKETTQDLEGGSLISFGFDEQDQGYDSGRHNYGIGINSSDNYVNLPERAISLFETEIHPNNTVKVSYDFKGILGTLPQSLNDTNYDIYRNMAGTQGIFTNNMYIGDANQFVAFYTDEHGDKRLRIQASQLVFEATDSGGQTSWQDVADIESQPGPQGPPGADGADGADGAPAITLEIVSSQGNCFLNGNISTRLTCTIREGTTDITNDFDSFTWSISPSISGWPKTTSVPYVDITSSDITNKAIITCTVTI